MTVPQVFLLYGVFVIAVYPTHVLAQTAIDIPEKSENLTFRITDSTVSSNKLQTLPDIVKNYEKALNLDNVKVLNLSNVAGESVKTLGINGSEWNDNPETQGSVEPLHDDFYHKTRLKNTTGEVQGNLDHAEAVKENESRIKDLGIEDGMDEEHLSEKVLLENVHNRNSPPAMGLKLSPSYTREVNSILIPKSPPVATESNDISLETLLSNLDISTERTVLSTIENDPKLKFVEPISKTTTRVPFKTKSNFLPDKKSETMENSIEDKWRDLEKMFRSYTGTVMKKALPKFLRIHSQLNISSQCNGALLQMVRGLRNFKSWAIKSKSAIFYHNLCLFLIYDQ